MTRRELPRDVLRAHRKYLRKSQSQYAAETGDGTSNWPKHKVENIEQGKSEEFTEKDYEEWRYSWVGDDGFDEFHPRLLEAIAYQKELKEQEEERQRQEQKQPRQPNKEPIKRSWFDRIIVPISIVVILAVVVICVLLALTYLPQAQQAAGLLQNKLAVTPVLATNPTPEIVVTTEPEVVVTVEEPIPTPEAQSTPLPSGVLFEDDFREGLDPAWETMQGDWWMINEGLGTTSAPSENPEILVGQTSWTDYAIEFDVNTHTVFDTVFAGIRVSDQAGLWFRFGRGDEQLLLCRDDECKAVVSEDTRNLPDIDHVRITAEGNHFATFVNGNKFFSMSSEYPSSGKAGFTISCEDTSHCTTIDNFKVTVLE